MEMIKHEETKDDGRYIIYYEFNEDKDSNLVKDIILSEDSDYDSKKDQ